MTGIDHSAADGGLRNSVRLVAQLLVSVICLILLLAFKDEFVALTVGFDRDR